MNNYDRWNPEYAEKGYVWCMDCQHLGEVCTHPGNAYRQQCIQAPRKCQWYESKIIALNTQLRVNSNDI